MSDDLHVAALQRLVARLRRRLDFVEGSRFWKLRDLWQSVLARAGVRPADDAPQIPPEEFVEAMDSFDPYTRWLLENEPRPRELSRMLSVARLLERRPSIAIVFDDVPPDAARELEAASAQTRAYDRCELVRTSRLEPAAQRWMRFNLGLAATTADLIVFCGVGEVFAPHAAFEAALAFLETPDAVAVYGDRDRLELDGRRSSPRFVADWSPDSFLGEMYTGRSIFYRRDAVVAAGGFREGCGSADHYDLALRVFERSQRIVHRASVLAHETNAPDGSADPDARRVAGEALVRRGEPGCVEPSPVCGVHVVRYQIRRPGRIEVIVPTRDRPEFLERCLASVFERNGGCEFRVTVIDNGSLEPATHELLAQYRRREAGRFRVVDLDAPFNYSQLVNAGVRATDGPYVFLLNNDARFVVDGGLLAMLEQAQRPEIGAVGARLLYPDGRLQHAGVAIGLGGFAGHVLRGVPASSEIAPGIRNVAAVTAAALMVRRDAYEAVDGFDELLAIEFNDIDFCLKLLGQGLLNLYLPHVVLEHVESSSRGIARSGSDLERRARERALFRDRWRSDTYRDPYYNANLSREGEDAALAP